MARDTKRIAKNTLVLYARMLFLTLISLYTSRVILHSLGVTDYGIYNVVAGFVTMFSMLTSVLTSANSRFLNYEMGRGNSERMKTVFSTSIEIHYALAFIVAILTETVGLWFLNNKMVIPADRLTAATWVFHISVFNFCTGLVTVPYNSAIVAHERMKTFAYVSILDGVVKLAISFLILYNPIDRLIYYAILLAILRMVLRSIYRNYSKRNFEECKFKFVKDKALIKEMFSYAGWHLFGNWSSVLKGQGVNMILNTFFGPVVNAARGVSGQVLHNVSKFSSNFMMALRPQITKSYASGELSYMFNLVYKGARFSFNIMFLLALPIFINADYILHLWLKEVPDYAVIFSQISLITALITSMSNTLVTAQNATGKVKYYQMVVGGILLMTLPVCYVVLRLGGSPVSGSLVVMSLEIIALMARLYMIPRTIPEFKPWDYFKRVIFNNLKVVACAAPIPALMYFLLPVNFWTFLLNCIVSFGLAVFAILYVGCTRHERQKIYGKIRSVLSKGKKKKNNLQEDAM